MVQSAIMTVIKDQTQRSLWSLHNVIDCIPDNIWSKLYCGTPLWKHVYHYYTNRIIGHAAFA